MGLSAAEVAAIRAKVLSGRREAMYGVVRASFGISNTVEDVVRIGDALEEIAATPERKPLYRGRILPEIGCRRAWRADRRCGFFRVE